MKAFNQYLQSQKDVQSIIDGVEGGLKEQLVAGLSGSARSMLVSAVGGIASSPNTAYYLSIGTGTTII